jgi:nitrite reductase/ring-hydroxylating ferredoxin subunit
MRRMTAPAEWRCALSDLPPGRTATFRLACGARVVDGFAVNHEGRYRAWVNRCPHAGTPLDLWPNEFWSEDGRSLVCATHGAHYEPDSGRCTAGPCAGDALEPLPCRIDGATLVVACASAGDADHGVGR